MVVRSKLLIGIFSAILIFGYGVQPAEARVKCFSENNICIEGRIQEFWALNGSVGIMGIAMTPIEQVFPGGVMRYAQQFEKVRVEFQPSGIEPYDVSLGNVGYEWVNYFSNTLSSLSTEAVATGLPNANACFTVQDSEIPVCGAFADFYMTHGASLDITDFYTRVEREFLFGKPLTPIMLQNSTGLWVQVFEHMRLDYNPYTQEVTVGKANLDLLSMGIANQSFDLLADSFLEDTGATILPADVLQGFVYRMPMHGYWETSQPDVYIAMVEPLYMNAFYNAIPKPGFRFVTMSVVVRNQRPAGSPAIYYDFTYIFLKDLQGRRYATPTLAARLDTPINGTTLQPGESAVGQLIYEIPIGTAPAQLEFNFANMDEWVSRWDTTFELRTWPLGVYY